MNASEMKDHMNEVLIKMSQVMAKQNNRMSLKKNFAPKPSLVQQVLMKMSLQIIPAKTQYCLSKCNYYGINQRKL